MSSLIAGGTGKKEGVSAATIGIAAGVIGVLLIISVLVVALLICRMKKKKLSKE